MKGPSYMLNCLTCEIVLHAKLSYMLNERGKTYFVAAVSKILRGNVAASAAFCSLVNQQAIRL